MTTTQQIAPRDIGLDKSIAALDATIERARIQYTEACQQARYGSTPQVRAAALATAQRLNTLAHQSTSEEIVQR